MNKAKATGKSGRSKKQRRESRERSESMLRSKSMFISNQSRDIANRRQDIAKRAQESADKHENITDLEEISLIRKYVSEWNDESTAQESTAQSLSSVLENPGVPVCVIVRKSSRWRGGQLASY